jgi:hypothetical protein
MRKMTIEKRIIASKRRIEVLILRLKLERKILKELERKK